MDHNTSAILLRRHTGLTDAAPGLRSVVGEDMPQQGQDGDGDSTSQPTARHQVRRSHKKSRHGCCYCKRRRIKVSYTRATCHSFHSPAYDSSYHDLRVHTSMLARSLFRCAVRRGQTRMWELCPFINPVRLLSRRTQC